MWLMAESVADLLGRLRFVSAPVETIYLNRDRTHDDFVGQLGAIDSFTRGATREGKLEVPLLKAGAGIGAEAGVTWTMADPTAQALVLRAALESQGLLYPLDRAEPGCYLEFAGRGLLSRPEMLQEEHRRGLAVWAGLYEELEVDRANQEKVLTVMAGGTPDLCWLMTIDSGDSVVAAVLGNRWLSPGVPSWLGGEARWSIFAKVRQRINRGFPLLAALHITATWG
jgi:hypothetical protein